MLANNRFFLAVLCFLGCAFFLFSCNTIDLYEKTIPIPKHKWNSSFKPQFRFTIKDTAVPYEVYIILRHTDRYNYKKIAVGYYCILGTPGVYHCSPGMVGPFFIKPERRNLPASKS